jgi:hypothetical protein
MAHKRKSRFHNPATGDHTGHKRQQSSPLRFRRHRVAARYAVSHRLPLRALPRQDRKRDATAPDPQDASASHQRPEYAALSAF